MRNAWFGLVFFCIVGCENIPSSLPPGSWQPGPRVDAENSWWVRSHSDELVGAGPSPWSADNVTWSRNGTVTLRLTAGVGDWTCAEAARPFPITATRVVFGVSAITPEPETPVVLGLFLYHDDHNEVDVELSRWATPRSYEHPNAQFTVAGTQHYRKYECDLSAPSQHEIYQAGSHVAFRSVCANGTFEWHHPVAAGFFEQGLNVHVNLWRIRNTSEIDTRSVSVDITRIDVDQDIGRVIPEGSDS